MGATMESSDIKPSIQPREIALIRIAACAQQTISSFFFSDFFFPFFFGVDLSRLFLAHRIEICVRQQDVCVYVRVAAIIYGFPFIAWRTLLAC